MKFQELKEKAVQLVRSLDKEYAAHIRGAVIRAAERVTLGEALPDLQSIMDAERANFTPTIDKARKTAEELIKEAEGELLAKKTKPIPPEIVGTITVLQGKKNVTPEDLDAILIPYGDNYFVQSAARDIAKANGINILISDYSDIDYSAIQRDIDLIAENLKHYLSIDTVENALKMTTVDGKTFTLEEGKDPSADFFEYALTNEGDIFGVFEA